MAIKIFYHQVKPGVDCPDGIASAWAAYRALQLWNKGRRIEVIGCCYQGEIPVVNPGDDIYIVDLSFPRAVLEEWEKICSLQVIDHHKTALADLEGFSAAIFDMNECGATLTYKTLNETPTVPVFLEYVRDRDLWKHELPATHEIHEAISSIKAKIKSAVQDEDVARALIFQFFDELAEMDRGEFIAYLEPIGAGLLEEKRKKVDAIASRFQWETFKVPYHFVMEDGISTEGGHDKYSVPVVYLAEDGGEDRYVSDVCQVLYKAHPKSPFVACKTSDGSWSLRSDQGNPTAADVSAIAKRFGGGGHKHAAGFKTTSNRV
jgi:oligoribonuclease NrnB/cAMP/cGMP phosphodiesterase (DHH superfamily)